MDSINKNDKKILRNLAKRYMEIASMDLMMQRKLLWKKLHDLKPERPMILFEPFSVEGFLPSSELQCKDPALRSIESRLRHNIKQFELLNDDIVFEKYIRIPWMDPFLTATAKEYGEVKIVEKHASEPTLAYLSNFPIKKPEDLEKLSSRNFTINKKPSLKLEAKLNEIFGDILPVRLGNYDNFGADIFNIENATQYFTGNNFIGITWDIFKLMGTENMVMWAYDHPDDLKKLCDFLVDDRKRFYKFLLDEKLLDFNTDNQFAGPSSYGYVSDLPDADSKKELRFEDLWCWPESQETEIFSPSMFNEFFLPAIAEIANMFGLSYYGCCEKVTDRFEYIAKAIPNLRVVSISGWSDTKKAGEMLGKNYVFSKKPVPSYTSGEVAYWNLVEKEASEVRDATRNGCLEVIFRDFYSTNCTTDRIINLIKIWKKILNI